MHHRASSGLWVSTASCCIRISSRKYSRRKAGSVSCSSTQGSRRVVVDTTRPAYSAAGCVRQFYALRALPRRSRRRLLPLRGALLQGDPRRYTAPPQALLAAVQPVAARSSETMPLRGLKRERPVGDTTPLRGRLSSLIFLGAMMPLRRRFANRGAARRIDGPSAGSIDGHTKSETTMPSPRAPTVAMLLGETSPLRRHSRFFVGDAFVGDTSPRARLLSTTSPRSNDAAPPAPSHLSIWNSE